MNISIRQKLVVFSFIVLAGNGILGYAVYKSNQKLLDSEHWVQHTEQVIYLSGNIISDVEDIEKASQSFAITKDTTFLEALHASCNEIVVYITQLKELTKDNPLQQRHIDTLNTYLEKSLDISSKMPALNKEAASVIAYSSTKKGRYYSNGIWKIANAIQHAENVLLIQRKRINDRNVLTFDRFLAIIFILFAGFTIALLIGINKYFFHNEEKGKRAAELVIANKELLFQNEEKEKRAAELGKANRLYAFISQINQKITHVKDGEALFKNACSIALEFGKFKIAWIGIFGNENKTITNIDQIGIPVADVKKFKDVPLEANGPQEQVLRTGKYYVSNDIMNDPKLETWKSLAVQQGVNSCMVLPIKKMGSIIGTFNLYAAEVGFFSKEEIKLVLEVTGDISYALDLFEKEKRHKETEELVLMNEKRFGVLIEKSTDMIALSKQDGELIYGSASIKKVLGYSMKELLKMSVFDIIHPDDIPEVIANRDKILPTPGKSFYYQQRRKHKDGRWIWCEGTLTNMLNDPAVRAMVSNFRNISEKKIMEQQREFDRNNMNALINNTSDLMWSVDTNFALITSNQPFNDILKLTTGREIVKGVRILDLALSPEQSKNYKKSYERAFTGESFTEVDYLGKPVNMWSEISYCPIRKGNEIIGTACHSRDITERKLAEQELLLTQFAVDNAGDAVLWMTPDACIVRVNEAACLMLGYEKEELLELSVSDIDPSLNAEKWAIHYAELRLNGSLIFETVQRAKYGRLIPVEIRANYIKFGDEEFNCAFCRDISERKLAETERVKMVNDLVVRNTELEQFGYIVSHNLRAPLANIIGASNVLNEPGLSTTDKHILNKGINDSVIKLDDVVKDLNHILQVKREINISKELVSFSGIVDDIKFSIKNLIDADNIEIKYDFNAINELLTSKPYLYSIFYNLISNSIKYRRQQVQSVIEIKSSIKKDKLELVFTDNGMGIDLEKNAGDIFGLYKRFHHHIEGKGMGLFMVKTQVETLGGKISLTSKANKGTVFNIKFDL